MLFGFAPPILNVFQVKIETVRRLSYERNDHRVLLRRIQGTTALFFQSKMSCDVDGSPNAYHPLDDNLSLDTIDSAGGRRQGNLPAGPLEVQPSPDVVVYQNGVPYLQPDGPFKGYYVSETSYMKPSMAPTDPTKYLDARTFHYVVLPGGLVPEAELGDLIVVYDPYSGNTTCAVFGDIGPSSESGEASLGTLKGLGLPATDGKSSPGQARDDLFYLVFPGTSASLEADSDWPHSQATIDSLAQAEFAKWGGVDRIKAILEQDPQAGSIKDDPESAWVFDELAWWKWTLPRGFEFALPTRLGDNGRLPCAPELIWGADSALGACQRLIGERERGSSAVFPPGLPGHLRGLLKVLQKFPVACEDEGISLVKSQAMVEALCDRLAALGIR